MVITINVVRTWEAALRDSAHKLEEPNTVLWVLGEVSVDHTQRHVED